MKRSSRPTRASSRSGARAGSAIAIIGTGLIGASIGLALRARASHQRVIGYDLDARRARAARRRGALTDVAATLRDAVCAADVVVLAMPHPAIVASLRAVMRAARPGTLVLDVAGLKAAVVSTARRELRRSPLVGFAGGHPMAGSHESGPQSAQARLFTGRSFALCIPPQPGRPALERRARAFVRALGAVPVMLEASEHDRQVGLTSALPQVVASATALASSGKRSPKSSRLTGPGWESVTRLAASPPGLWKDALVANRRNVVPALRSLEGWIRNFRTAIQRCDGMQLARLLRKAAVAQRRMKSS